MEIGNPNLRVLVIDDNLSIHDDFKKVLHADVAENALQEARTSLFGEDQAVLATEHFQVDCAAQGETGLSLVRKAKERGCPYAVAFVDMRMPPGWDGLETIEHLWAEDELLQVVICTAYSDQPWDEIRARIGRNDKLLILQKPFNGIEALQLATALCRKWDLAQKVAWQLGELSKLVRDRTEELQASNKQLKETNKVLVRTVSDLQEAQSQVLRQHQELERLASRDPLTGCLNRRAFFAEFEKAFAENQLQGIEFCCLMVDIDHFKCVNDQFGHGVGDQAIQAVAVCLGVGLRLTDLICRYGGEEFCLMFPGTSLREASDLAERLRAHVEAEAAERVRTVPRLVLTVSCGVSSTVFGARTPLELIDQADKALYAAKESGRNCVMALDLMRDGFNTVDQVEPQVKRITPRLANPPAA